MEKDSKYSSPLVFNVFKPPGISSYDVIRYFKNNLPFDYGKIGHLGTLDPFACGVLLVGVLGATKINDYVHSSLPKTYLAIGKLGAESATGDLTGSEITTCSVDQRLKQMSVVKLEQKLRERFLGDYYQVPHAYSATKFQGKKLHEWAREEGVEIKKPAVLRKIYELKIVKYKFPYLLIRVEVSSGTYIRTLFSDCAKCLGTVGVLISLIRQSIGDIRVEDSLKKNYWPKKNNWEPLKYALTLDQVLPLESVALDATSAQKYRNGQQIPYNGLLGGRRWVYDQNQLLIGMGQVIDSHLAVVFNLN